MVSQDPMPGHEMLMRERPVRVPRTRVDDTTRSCQVWAKDIGISTKPWGKMKHAPEAP